MRQVRPLLRATFAALALTGCGSNPFSDAFTFRYKYAQRLGNAQRHEFTRWARYGAGSRTFAEVAASNAGMSSG